MSLPEELIKPIDEIKTASNKVLVICLILAIVFLAGRDFLKSDSYKDTIRYERTQKMIFKEDARLKDSALNECGRELLRQAYKHQENANLRTEITENIKQKIKLKQ